jgi:hypothetical protein
VGRDTGTAKSDAGREKGREPAAGYGSVQHLNLYVLPFFVCVRQENNRVQVLSADNDLETTSFT